MPTLCVFVGPVVESFGKVAHTINTAAATGTTTIATAATTSSPTLRPSLLPMLPVQPPLLLLLPVLGRRPGILCQWRRLYL